LIFNIVDLGNFLISLMYKFATNLLMNSLVW